MTSFIFKTKTHDVTEPLAFLHVTTQLVNFKAETNFQMNIFHSIRGVFPKKKKEIKARNELFEMHYSMFHYYYIKEFIYEVNLT